MRTSLISTFILTVCVTLTLTAQVACDHKGPLNDNEGAQVAQANTNTNNAQIAQARNDNTNSDRVAAVEQPAASPGDRNANSVRVPPGAVAARVYSPSREEVEKNKEYYQQLARNQGRTIGNGPDDTWIWVRSRFVLRFSISDSSINVDVDNGAVTLSGTVTNQEQVTRAESLVREIEGVRSVQNSLIVKPPE